MKLLPMITPSHETARDILDWISSLPPDVAKGEMLVYSIDLLKALQDGQDFDPVRYMQNRISRLDRIRIAACRELPFSPFPAQN